MIDGPMISLCHTTARGQNGWQEAHMRWMGTTKDPRSVEYILSAEEEIDTGSVARFVLNTGVRSSTAGWNAAARASTGKILISIADDYFPLFDGWDQIIPENFPDLDGQWVLNVDNNDNAHPLMAFSFMTRPYYERYGYMVYPEYQGMMADWDFTSVAYRDQVVVEAAHLKFQHLNPEEGTAKWDNIYRWQRRSCALEQGQQIYDHRKRTGAFSRDGVLVVK